MSDSHSTNLLALQDEGEEANAEDNPPSSHWYFLTPHEIAQVLHWDYENGLSSLAAFRPFQPEAAQLCPSARSVPFIQFQSLLVALLLRAAGLLFLFNQARGGFTLLIVGAPTTLIGLTVRPCILSPFPLRLFSRTEKTVKARQQRWFRALLSCAQPVGMYRLMGG